MTESPYRQSTPRAPRPRHGSRAMNGCLDVVLGLLLVLLEGLICAVAAYSLTLSRWDPGASEATGPPPMDWTPVLVFGGIAAAVALIAVVLIRENRPWAGAIQIPVALLLCMAAVQVGHEDYRRSHPAPASAPPDDPGRSGHQCLSGGDNRECLDSGG
ncbi:DUF6234 family protein [Streptomyces atratus]|uniref:DUF6234 family protein n=1 Tax=Streptomyces atratus TaxID=1893 RepID=UPI0013006F08|nr:DUF6234 family protein [Streptomyces atratus]